ncbi:MAG: ABC transporter ATP-binding protein [Eubacteriales bacterium]|nr:ABC transporter ATP-binding protein [Eubacteriales bacterium]
MFGKNFQRKYALTDQGVRNVKTGTFWTVVVNLIVMSGVSILYFLMSGFMGTLTLGQPLPEALPVIGLAALFVVLSFITHLQQYKATYGLVYDEVKATRLGLAEQLRRLPLACLWGVPVAFGLLFGSRKMSARSAEQTKKAAVRVSDGIQEALENIREIRSCSQEERYQKGLNQKVDDLEGAMIRGELGVGIFVNAASVIMRLGVVTTILLGAELILSGKIDFMLLFLFLMVITRIYAPFDQCLGLVAEMFVSQVSADRMQEIYEMPTAKGGDQYEPGNHDIVFEHVSFSYDDKEVLHDVSFTAREGEVTALVGPSGSGKSTCARLAARLWDVDSGVIRAGGVDISTVDPEVLLRDYSVVFQDVVLFDDMVMENIRLGRRGASDEEVRADAEAANCGEFIRRLPEGYDTPIGENGTRLSGGERQRISIARALLKDAPIVLLDEATASLDVENETKIQEALSRLLAGKTVLVIAHRMRTVEAADKVIVLSGGQVAEQGTPAELMAGNGAFCRMVELQKQNAQWRLE